ncbi:hypothetical protein PanWU01x14_142920 [Parasponia andersonii]|uniref:Disease resistance protein At4g27190-like leucine-rich repeats domain-containing protein n=1 Tax=Parasponia andersonii TaxID=3476 RepID=A0A2P5CLF7_PARAD|nr:hypothetical protein PanWU01x14_142920 [Parasponia andersonii]
MRFLFIHECKGVEEIIRVEKLGDAPEVLKSLQLALILQELPKLKNIYPKPLPFPCLENIRVQKCEELKKLPVSSGITRRGVNKSYSLMSFPLLFTISSILVILLCDKIYFCYFTCYRHLLSLNYEIDN